MTAQAQPVSGNIAVASLRLERWLIFGNLFAALSAGALAAWSTPMMLAILYIDVWLFANPHVVATYTRIHAISSSVRTHWALIFVAPVLILAGLTLIALAYEVAGLFALYFVMQAFHVARQSHGIAKRFDHRLQMPYQRLPYFLIYIFPVWGYLHRSAQAPTSFLGYPIWLPPVSQELVLGISIVAVVGALWWLARLWHCKGTGPANELFNGFIFSHLLVSLVAYVWIDDITVGWLVVNVWHNIQYLIFVYRQQQKNSGVKSELASTQRYSSIVLLKPAAIFFGVCAICGAVLYVITSRVGESLLWLGIPTILIAHFILNFHHYLADSLIWKRRRAV